MTKRFVIQVQNLNKFLKNFNLWVKQQWDFKHKALMPGRKYIRRAEKESKSHNPVNESHDQSEKPKRTYSKHFNTKHAEARDENVKKKPLIPNINESGTRSMKTAPDRNSEPIDKPKPEPNRKPNVTSEWTKSYDEMIKKPSVSEIIAKYYDIIKKSAKNTEMLERRRHTMSISEPKNVELTENTTRQIAQVSRETLNAIKTVKTRMIEEDEYRDDYKGLRYELVHNKNLPEFLEFVQSSDCSEEPFGRCFKHCLNGASCGFVEYHAYRSVSEGLSTFIRNKRGKIIGAAMNTIMKPHDIEGEAISLRNIKYNQIKKHYAVLHHHLINRNPFNTFNIKKLFDIRFMLVDREYNFKTIAQKLLEACETMAKGRQLKFIKSDVVSENAHRLFEANNYKMLGETTFYESHSANNKSEYKLRLYYKTFK
uniref:N-acetyltransferase domain-containing protein n=1 Tax=Glossina brevipalpis TaxID=37001 RepID=A0A1A9WWY5_9MUSC